MVSGIVTLWYTGGGSDKLYRVVLESGAISPAEMRHKVTGMWKRRTSPTWQSKVYYEGEVSYTAAMWARTLLEEKLQKGYRVTGTDGDTKDWLPSHAKWAPASNATPFTPKSQPPVPAKPAKVAVPPPPQKPVESAREAIAVLTREGCRVEIIVTVRKCIRWVWEVTRRIQAQGGEWTEMNRAETTDCAHAYTIARQEVDWYREAEYEVMWSAGETAFRLIGKNPAGKPKLAVVPGPATTVRQAAKAMPEPENAPAAAYKRRLRL